MYDWAELRHFRYLLTILERQGFRVAAEELHTSQPNLSVQARQFQENASVRLYKKLKNGRIRPTETGLAFIALAKLLLETRDEVINALIAIERGEIGAVRFGCTPLVDQSLFRSFCAMHKEMLPACTIRPTHGDTVQLAEEVLAGAVDAAIVTLPLKHTELRIEEIRRDRLVVCLRRDAELFKMNEQQIALFESLQDREALYMRRDGITKVVTLNLDKRSYATFSTKPKDRVRRSKLIEKYGLTEGIARFAQGEAV